MYIGKLAAILISEFRVGRYSPGLDHGPCKIGCLRNRKFVESVNFDSMAMQDIVKKPTNCQGMGTQGTIVVYTYLGYRLLQLREPFQPSGEITREFDVAFRVVEFREAPGQLDCYDKQHFANSLVRELPFAIPTAAVSRAKYAGWHGWQVMHYSLVLFADIIACWYFGKHAVPDVSVKFPKSFRASLCAVAENMNAIGFEVTRVEL
ncbi:MAG: hypothetical protein BJ554DRAFT_3278 [Olpidium bornovanus]|uniref:Uncharacterized protein n=1 Tax=Olpidium bornovanus TaxID=278681 RepID=A0A8H7ZPQ2_9FUNG|nr:MAG: hypothetical protein BJ554DRAFT_3278 [Olpidium bornovanus]